jgi:acetyl esterase/lipase
VPIRLFPRGHRIVVAVLTCASALTFLACSSSSTGSDDGDHIVEGVNLTQLFQPPTAQEQQAVVADWAARSVAASGAVIVNASPVSLGGTAATVSIISHTLGGVTRFGAAIAPDNSGPGSLPLVVYSHGGDTGVDVSELLTILTVALASAQDDYVYLIPSFRSEPLTYQGVTYQSTGTASPWDHDVDDALALVNSALSLIPAADPDRIGVVGFSRGACVGMLMAIRDDRIDVVIEFFGPTDFYGDFAQDVFEDALTGTLRPLPGLQALNAEIIQPLKNGTMSYSDARLAMLRRSPVYFVDRLPPTQAHHGRSDNIVPVGEAERLREVFDDTDLEAPDYAVFLYTGGTHNPITLLGSFERARGFLERLNAPTFANGAD